MATAQAALLLSFWTPPLRADSKPNTMWLMIAIENAKKSGADYYSDESNLGRVQVGGKYAAMRRLWWCCIIRDRILPLGVRRSIQITPAHFDLRKNMYLGLAELKAEIRNSKGHCEHTKDDLTSIMEAIVNLCVELTDILLLAFPLKSTVDQFDCILLEIRKCKDALYRWYDETPFRNYGSGTTDQAVILNVNLMYTYYQ